MEVDILLSTYNSERFLDDLFFSLEQQSFLDWKLIIRDDGSTDGTLGLILKFEEKNQNRVLIVNNNGLNLGVKKSFVELIKQSTSNYIMFCDHDDYWLTNKINYSLKRIKEVEKLNPGKPALVCSDLIVADKDLQIIHSSFWKRSRIDPENIKNIYRLAINNAVVGCTVMMNREAKSIALPIPEQAVMHDWWIALKVAQNGVIGLIEEPTILYRQHPDNAIGAKSVENYSRLRISDLKTTIRNNIDGYKMFKTLDPDFSVLKLLRVKIVMTFQRIFNY
jgi:glycosyltransferase involved in cell wall biosynthesis